MLSVLKTQFWDRFQSFCYSLKNRVKFDYRRPGTIVQTDIDGNIRIPSSLHARNPFFEYKLYPEIYAIYDPKTHCVGILPSKLWLKRYKPYKQDGLREFKRLYWWFETKKIDGIDVLIFKDVTDDPAKWYSSIRQLRKAFKYCDVVGYWNGWEASFEQRKELYDYLVHEYESLRSQYRNKPCGSMAPENMGIETFSDLISYDFVHYLKYYEKEVLGQKN